MSVYRPRGRERVRCRLRRRLLFPKCFVLFPSGMRHEDCSVCTFHRSVLQRPRLRPKTTVNPVRLLGCWECGDRRLKLFPRSGMIKSANVLPMMYWRDQPQTGAERKHQVTSRPLPGLRRLDRIPGHDSLFDSRALSPHGVRSLQGLVRHSSCKDVWATKGVHCTLQEESEESEVCIHLVSP